MKILFYLIIIFFPPFLLLLNFRFLIYNSGFYQSEFRNLGVYQNIRQEIANPVAESLINYFCCAGKLEEGFFTSDELQHLADVKNLIHLTIIQFFLILALITFCAVILFVKNKRLLAQSVKWGSAVTIISIILLATGIFSRFDEFFIKMHLVLFTNDLWQLPPESNLIKLFPQQFFVDFANRLAYQTIGMASAIFILASLVKKYVAKVN